MADSKKPTKSAPVFDVAHPGAPKLTDAATSRAIIIKHPSVQDPMVNGAPVADPVASKPEPASEPASPSTKKVVIKPLHETLDAPSENNNTESPVAAEEAPKPESSKDSPIEEKPTETASVDAPAADANTEDQDAQRAALVAKLVDSEEYFLPIETTEQRRSKRSAILGSLVIIVLLLAWYNVALDASLLPNTFSLPHSAFFTTEAGK